MRLAKPIFMAVLAVALAAYAFDCGATTTPEQAMQCCKSMSCPSHGHHGQDCCKTMQAMHSPFAQPAAVHSLSYTPLVFAVLSASGNLEEFDPSDRVIAANGHAPPFLCALSPLPLRI
jgi:hypothetical protein